MSKIEVNTVEPQCGTTLTIGASDTSIAGIGTVNWDTTKKTTAFTAVSGRGYFVDVSSSALTATLPASPSAGNIVAISDYAKNAATNNITIGRNGSNIQGSASDLVIRRNGVALTLVFVDATKGWIVTDSGTELDKEPEPEYVAATGGTITCCGDFKIHTFTGPGTFCVSCAGNEIGSNSIQYLVVAAGGGGGHDNGGGGGGGSVVTASADTGITTQAYPITVGGGGAGGPGSPSNTDPGVSGSPTTFFSITALRGGGGRTSCGGTAATPVGNGGGGAGVSSSNIGCSGTASSPIPASATNFGANAGGNGTNGTCSVFRSGGGGGAGGAGNSGAPGPVSSHGGDGTPSNICGTTYFYGGGGGGGVFCGSAGDGGQGGSGGGGGGNCTPSPAGAAGANGRNAGSAGSTHPSGAGGNAGANTGSGGGGSGRAGSGAGGNGGSGIVIIKYKFRN